MPGRPSRWARLSSKVRTTGSTGEIYHGSPAEDTSSAAWTRREDEYDPINHESRNDPSYAEASAWVQRGSSSAVTWAEDEPQRGGNRHHPRASQPQAPTEPRNGNPTCRSSFRLALQKGAASTTECESPQFGEECNGDRPPLRRVPAHSFLLGMGLGPRNRGTLADKATSPPLPPSRRQCGTSDTCLGLPMPPSLEPSQSEDQTTHGPRPRALGARARVTGECPTPAHRLCSVDTSSAAPPQAKRGNLLCA